MEPFETITGPVSTLMRDDVDTDQIIPKQFLKRVERTGFGEFLFYDWAKEPGWDLPVNPVLVDRAQLRLRLEPRACPVGARGLRLPRGRRAELRGHLLLQLHEDRAAAGRAGGGCRRARSPRRGRPRSTSPSSRCAGRAGSPTSTSTPTSSYRLLNGLDDIGLTLAQADQIDAYERDRQRNGPVTTAL